VRAAVGAIAGAAGLAGLADAVTARVDVLGAEAGGEGVVGDTIEGALREVRPRAVLLAARVAAPQMGERRARVGARERTGAEAALGRGQQALVVADEEPLAIEEVSEEAALPDGEAVQLRGRGGNGLPLRGGAQDGDQDAAPVLVDEGPQARGDDLLLLQGHWRAVGPGRCQSEAAVPDRGDRAIRVRPGVSPSGSAAC